MLERYFRPAYQFVLVNPLSYLLEDRVSANHVTLFATIVGLLTIPTLAFGFPIIACVLLFISGYCDTLDGSLARLQQKDTPFGTVMDISCDRIVEAAVILGLFSVVPTERGLLCLLMLSSILICVTTFLVVGIFSDNDSEKSFHYSPGLIERPEAFIFFGAMMLLPMHFMALSLLFSTLTLFTAGWRVFEFKKILGAKALI